MLVKYCMNCRILLFYFVTLLRNINADVIYMETMMQGIYVNLPASDMKFFKELVKKMGWSIDTKRMSGIDKALKDVDEGRVYKAKDVDDLFNQILG